MADCAVGVIGGTGIGERLAERSGVERIGVDTPFGRPSGPILKASIDGVTCLAAYDIQSTDGIPVLIPSVAIDDNGNPLPVE